MSLYDKIADFLEWFSRPVVIVQLDDSAAQLPLYASPGSAGADLFSVENIHIPAKSKVLVPTGIRMNIPKHHFGSIRSRSGLSVKFSLESGAGVIDYGYEGQIGVVLHNHGDSPYNVKRGERVAQIICQKYVKMSFVPGNIKTGSERGQGGFGSTGK
jgi:dUTP pyrophosphatase